MNGSSTSLAGPRPGGGASSNTRGTVADLQSLRRFQGPLEAFWPLYLQGAGLLVGARCALFITRNPGETGWVPLAAWPVHLAPAELLTSFSPGLAAAETALQAGHGIGEVPCEKGVDAALIAVRLAVGEGQPVAVLAVLLAAGPAPYLEASAVLLRLVSDVPESYQRERALQQASGDVVRFAEALDLMVLLNEDKRFVRAAMTFCNEVAARFRCTRVSLGWLEGEYVRLKTMSQAERLEERTSAVQALDACMEETLDQDEEIVWPSPAGCESVTRAHEAYARRFATGHLVSLPVRLDDQAIAVVTCERADAPFLEPDVGSLRLMTDQASRRLGDLKRHDRWFGARAAVVLREWLGVVFGVEHTFAKVLGLVLALLVWFLAVGTWDYRIEGTFALKTDDILFLPAPFEGYIDEVRAQIGDSVKKDELLLTLDARELLLEESAAIAEISRHAREAEKSQQKNSLADMKISLALAAQSQARLNKVRHRLEAARIKAPMAGLVVEGDLKKLLGAPVRKGDILFKIARIERTYAEVQVDERDVHEISAGARGEASFVSRPNLTFPVIVQRIDPVAMAKEGHNEFVVRAAFAGPAAGWWRPGMSGVVKVNVGRRGVFWILTHRTIEHLRLALWW